MVEASWGRFVSSSGASHLLQLGEEAIEAVFFRHINESDGPVDIVRFLSIARFSSTVRLPPSIARFPYVVHLPSLERLTSIMLLPPL